MWLNQLFVDQPIDFEKRCRRRIKVSMALIVLGILSVAFVGLAQGDIPVHYLEPGAKTFISGFYTGIGCGLIAAGIITVIKNRNYLRNADLKKRQEVYETMSAIECLD